MGGWDVMDQLILSLIALDMLSAARRPARYLGGLCSLPRVEQDKVKGTILASRFSRGFSGEVRCPVRPPPAPFTSNERRHFRSPRFGPRREHLPRLHFRVPSPSFQLWYAPPNFRHYRRELVDTGQRHSSPVYLLDDWSHIF